MSYAGPVPRASSLGVAQEGRLRAPHHFLEGLQWTGSVLPHPLPPPITETHLPSHGQQTMDVGPQDLASVQFSANTGHRRG